MVGLLATNFGHGTCHGLLAQICQHDPGTLGSKELRGGQANSNKYEIFEAVVRDAAEKLFLGMSGLGLDPDRPSESLRRAAQAISRVYDTRDHIEVTRLIIAETPRHPEVCQQARDQIIGVMSGELVEFFSGLSNRGSMTGGLVRQATLTFLLIFSKGFRPLFGVVGDEAEESRQFEADLRMFALGYGIPF